jgi:hypothetical protein
MTKTLRASHADVTSFGEILAAGITITPTLIDIVGSWFSNVEIIFPIPEMPIDAAERDALAKTVTTEMAEAFADAIVKLEGGAEFEDTLEVLAPKVDGLWRELAGLYASEMNEHFADRTEAVDVDAIRERITSMLEHAEEFGIDPADLRAELLDDQARAQLRKMGIDPDSL